MEFFLILLPLVCTAYLLRMLLAVYSHSVKHIGDADRTPYVSVIVPFRDEENNLQTLLDGLTAQDYSGQFEVVLVNDRSADGFAKIVSPFLARHKNFRMIDSGHSPSVKLTGKQQALDAGTAAAFGEWFVFTDADARPSSNWISLLMNSTDEKTGCVCGRTELLHNQMVPFERYQAWQLDFLFAVAFAFDKAKMRGACMGNNMAVSRAAWEKVGGMRGLGYSIVEDCDLLARISESGFSCRQTQPFTVSVQTLPCPDFGSFARQALRWTKGGMRRGNPLIISIAAIGLQNFCFIAVLLGLLNGPAALVAFVNLFLMWLFVRRVFRINGSAVKSGEFPLFYLFMCVQSVFGLWQILFAGKVVWKGDTV